MATLDTTYGYKDLAMLLVSLESDSSKQSFVIMCINTRT